MASISEISSKRYELSFGDKLFLGQIRRFITDDGCIYDLLNDLGNIMYNISSFFITFRLPIRVTDTNLVSLEELYLNSFVLFMTLFDYTDHKKIYLPGADKDSGLITLYELKNHVISELIIKCHTDVWNFKSLYPLGG